MMFPLVRDMAQTKGTTQTTIRVPVVVSCRVLGFSRQAYYQWISCPVSQRDWDDAHLINAAVDLHAEDPGLGYRLIADELPEMGITAGENRVHRLCKLQRIRSFHSVKNGSRNKPGPAVHDDLVARKFHATGPNRLWLTDITEHSTQEGKLYLCAVKDVWSNRIVGYSIDTRMKKRIAINALRMAVQRRGEVPGCIVHSDRGSQFRSDGYLAELKAHQLTGSMGRVGSSADNAAMESLFALLQKNILNRHPWTTRQELRVAMVTWIENSYHRRRRQRRLGKLTPVEFEVVHQQAVQAA
jgi:putative transposase